MLKITVQLLNEGKSNNGAWSYKQLRALGINPRFNSGWLKKSIGIPITQEQLNTFLALKNKHIKNKQPQRRQEKLFKDDIPGMIPYEDYLHMQSIKQEIKNTQSHNCKECYHFKTNNCTFRIDGGCIEYIEAKEIFAEV